MRIAIILNNKYNHDPEKVLETISKEGNIDYLVKGEGNSEFPKLSLVESYDYSVFGPEDVPEFVDELSRVKEEVCDPSDKKHIDDIIHLAEKCKSTPDTVLIFAG